METPQTTQSLPRGVTLLGPQKARFDEILTPEALAFVARLHRRFDAKRQQLLQERRDRQRLWDKGALPGFLQETEEIRNDPEWQVSPLPEGLQDRRVEITGPVERKMMINAFNSGAQVFMPDFEDSNSPTWENNVQGQVNLLDYSHDRLHHKDPKSGKEYALDDDAAVPIVRVRGLHLPEAHMRVDDEPVAASFFDFGLHVWHNAHALVEKELGPWYYLPKLEDRMEARLWNDIFVEAEKELELEHGSIKATCLIETFSAAFQMDEILYELKDHMAGLNAGRWDYIFSCIKVAREHPEKVLPDRKEVTMGVPFMRAYAQLLVQTCHKRGAFAMGGMSAFIPNRRDPEVTKSALEAVRADKKREVEDGCDGTWVAHPDLVTVAQEVFDAYLKGATNQAGRQRDDLEVTEEELQDFTVPDGHVTIEGLRNNLEVSLRYLEQWLGGRGAVAIHNLMEDAATAEISRSQLWQWIHHRVPLDNGTLVTKEFVNILLDAVVTEERSERDDEAGRHRLRVAADLLRDVSLADDLPEFLTLPAYAVLIQETQS